MRAENLLALSAPHGVDLLQAAVTRLPHPQRSFGPRSGREARGRQTQSLERPAWTVQELGLAAEGVPELQFRAALYAFAGDRTHYWSLHSALAIAGLELAAKYRWGRTMGTGTAPRFYIEALAALVLDEDARPQVFREAPALYSAYVGATEETWNKQLEWKFEQLKRRWQGWLIDAASIMQPRLESQELLAE